MSDDYGGVTRFVNWCLNALLVLIGIYGLTSVCHGWFWLLAPIYLYMVYDGITGWVEGKENSKVLREEDIT